MSVTPTGSLSRAVFGLEELVADAASWRTLTGASSRDEARKFIGLGVEQIGSLSSGPLAVITLGGGAALQIGQGQQIQLGSSGQVALTLRTDAIAGSEKDAYQTALNQLGELLDEIGDNSGKDYNAGAAIYWSFTAFDILLEPIRTQLEHRAAGEDVFLSAVAFDYGV